jgi:hypothetical protein
MKKNIPSRLRLRRCPLIVPPTPSSLWSLCCCPMLSLQLPFYRRCHRCSSVSSRRGTTVKVTMHESRRKSTERPDVSY